MPDQDCLPESLRGLPGSNTTQPWPLDMDKVRLDLFGLLHLINP